MRLLKGIGALILTVLVLAVIIIGGTNLAMYFTTRDDIIAQSQVSQKVSDADCILVLGASVLPNGTPSTILQDRLDVGADLYFAGAAPKIIVSGDNGVENYNEVAAMKAYLVAQGVPSEDVFCDHAGFNTYDSMYRAQYIFGVKTMIVVTQTYHQYRALYNAQNLGMKAYGVASDLRTYADQGYYDMREIFARTKDFWQVLIHAQPTVLGASISLSGSGDVTN